ncbi:MAG: hypothetical protein K2O29_07275 [Ruminococcus sp.]|nr:hypothetical protein [Ruminococcus sp.]
MKTDISESEAIIEALADITRFIHENHSLHELKWCSNGTSTATYKINNYLIVVKRDANNSTFSIKVKLKKHSTITGKVIDRNILATPFDHKIPF